MITAAEAIHHFYPLDDKISLHYKVWGTKQAIPVLFVHGGPGNCVDGYNNSEFFDAEKYYVIEVDQRGCGLSAPSVTSDYRNMQHYMDISIDQMSDDFEAIRQHLAIERWLVFGGSWGSALSIYYAEKYPEKCLGLIIRGIFLNTKAEFDAVYLRSSFDGNDRRLKEFDIFFELAAQEANRRGEPQLDHFDSERFIRLYESMIVRGDRDAIWRFFVFENNLVVEDPSELYDPFTIDENAYPEATSVAFFETRLFLRGTFEEPINLLGKAAENLRQIPIWIVQGTGDEVCPEVYAQNLVKRLEELNCSQKAYFVNGGHLASSDLVSKALQDCVAQFYLSQSI